MKKDMTRGHELRLIILFALPMMAANLLQQLYNTVDNIIVGNFAEAAAPGSFSAVGAVAPLTFFYLAFAMGASVGVNVICSQLYGARQEKRLAVAVDTALILLGVMGVGMMIIGFFLSPVLLTYVLRVNNANVYQYALLYLRIYCIGLPFQFVYNAIASALRSVGDSKASLIFLLISSLTNVVLDLGFIILFNWGVAGAAIATVISQLICVIVSYLYLRRRFPRRPGEQKFDGVICKGFVKTGIPIAIQQSFVSVGNIAMMRLVMYFVDINPAGISISDAFTAGNRIDGFFFVPIFGIQSALATFTGQNIAANRLDRVKRGYYMTLVVSFCVAAVLCLSLYFAASPVVKLFGIQGLAVEIGSEQVRFYATIFWIFAIYMTLGGVLQGAGDTLLQSFATMSALTIRIILAYLGVYVFSWYGYEATWKTLVFGWVSALIISNVRFYTGGWKKKVFARRSEGDAPSSPAESDSAVITAAGETAKSEQEV